MKKETLLEFFREMSSTFIQFVPKVIGFFVLIIIGWIVAKFIARLVNKFLIKLNANKITDQLQDISFIRKANVDFNLSTIISKAIYYFIYFIFLMVAIDVLGIEALSNLFRDFINYLPNVFVAGIILLGGLLLADVIRKAISTATQSLGIPSGAMIANFIFYFLVVNIFIIALGQAKIETSFLASNITYVFAGGIFAFALGYGIASKDTVSNYLASFYTKDKVNIGDDIKIGDIRGVVRNIDKSSLTLEADEGKVIIPLRRFNNENIEFFNS